MPMAVYFACCSDRFGGSVGIRGGVDSSRGGFVLDGWRAEPMEIWMVGVLF